MLLKFTPIASADVERSDYKRKNFTSENLKQRMVVYSKPWNLIKFCILLGKPVDFVMFFLLFFFVEPIWTFFQFHEPKTHFIEPIFSHSGYKYILLCSILIVTVSKSKKAANNQYELYYLGCNCFLVCIYRILLTRKGSKKLFIFLNF